MAAAARSLPGVPSIPSSMMFLPLFDGMGLSDLPLTQNGGINRTIGDVSNLHAYIKIAMLINANEQELVGL